MISNNYKYSKYHYYKDGKKTSVLNFDTIIKETKENFSSLKLFIFYRFSDQKINKIESIVSKKLNNDAFDLKAEKILFLFNEEGYILKVPVITGIYYNNILYRYEYRDKKTYDNRKQIASITYDFNNNVFRDFYEIFYDEEGRIIEIVKNIKHRQNNETEINNEDYYIYLEDKLININISYDTENKKKCAI